MIGEIGQEQVGAERTLGQLVADTSKELSDLVRFEMALAKAELRRDLQHGATAGAMFAAAAYLVALVTVMLSIAAALGLIAAGVWDWAAFLIVAGVQLLLAAIFVLIGRAQATRIRPPERAIQTTKESVATLRDAARTSAAS